MRRVHREETERVGANRLGRKSRWKRGLAYRRTEETALCSTGHVRNGSCSSGGVWRTAKRTKRTSYGRNGGPVDREGCGVPQNGRNGPPTVETGVLFIGRGVAYRKTGLHGILFISTVDLLQPPRATVDLLRPPRAPVHPASTARYSTGYCSTTPPRAPLHHLLFIQPSTPRGPVQPPLHGHPSTVYCSSSPPHHGVLFNHPSTGIPPPSTVHPALHHTMGSCSSRGNATAHCSSNPPHSSLFIPEAASIGFS